MEAVLEGLWKRSRAARSREGQPLCSSWVVWYVDVVVVVPLCVTVCEVGGGGVASVAACYI